MCSNENIEKFYIKIQQEHVFTHVFTYSTCCQQFALGLLIQWKVVPMQTINSDICLYLCLYVIVLGSLNNRIINQYFNISFHFMSFHSLLSYF